MHPETSNDGGLFDDLPGYVTLKDSAAALADTVGELRVDLDLSAKNPKVLRASGHLKTSARTLIGAHVPLALKSQPLLVRGALRRYFIRASIAVLPYCESARVRSDRNQPVTLEYLPMCRQHGIYLLPPVPPVQRHRLLAGAVDVQYRALW